MFPYIILPPQSRHPPSWDQNIDLVEEFLSDTVHCNKKTVVYIGSSNTVVLEEIISEMHTLYHRYFFQIFSPFKGT